MLVKPGVPPIMFKSNVRNQTISGIWNLLRIINSKNRNEIWNTEFVIGGLESGISKPFLPGLNWNLNVELEYQNFNVGIQTLTETHYF